MFDLQEFIVSCKQFVGAPDGARRVLDLMRSVVGDAEEIKSAVVPGESQRAIRDLTLFRSSELFVLNAAVYPHFKSPPHDHRMWAVIGIYEGQENNTFYRRSGEGVEEINRREIRAGEAILLGPEVIHAIENPLGSSTLGLHVYGGDIFAATRSMWHPRTGEELPYDVPQFFKWCKELAEAPRAV
jgi:predicted metal-dependent enzyme (double-stranded beta helix superfamily)